MQAFPHGPIMPGSGGGGDAHNGGDALRSSQIQAAQKDLYSSGKEAAGGAAEAVKEAVASVDQSTTEAVRHGSAAATSAIGGMVERASQAVRHAEEAVKVGSLVRLAVARLCGCATPHHAHARCVLLWLHAVTGRRVRIAAHAVFTRAPV